MHYASSFICIRCFGFASFVPCKSFHFRYFTFKYEFRGWWEPPETGWDEGSNWRTGDDHGGRDDQVHPGHVHDLMISLVSLAKYKLKCSDNEQGNDLEMLRLRTNKYQFVVVPDSQFLLVMVLNPWLNDNFVLKPY